MPHNKKRWTSWTIGLVVLALVAYIMTYDLGTEAIGVTDIQGCSRITTDFVTLEGVYILGPEKRFQLIAGDAVNWAALRNFAAESPGASVDPVVELELECTDTRCFPAHPPRALVSSAPPQAMQHIIDRLSTWRFSPYRKGRIRYAFDVTRHRLIVDTTKLVPTELQDAAQIPVEKTYTVQSLHDRYVRHVSLGTR